jgi:hypothetical protein
MYSSKKIYLKIYYSTGIYKKEKQTVLFFNVYSDVYISLINNGLENKYYRI